jgi:DNA-3-methyladenine glycosylase
MKVNQQAIIPRISYERDTVIVAQQLVGKLLVRETGGRRLSGIIVETEAYKGYKDTASHAHKGPTDRCKVMFGKAGFAYVYLTYGIHDMLNFVTEKKGFPSAVLIRAIEPVEGVDIMRINRKNVAKKRELTSGPGKLTKALGITRELNGIDLTNGSDIWVESLIAEVPENIRKKTFQIGTSTRIGIDYADKWSRSRKWRFYIKDNPFVSK